MITINRLTLTNFLSFFEENTLKFTKGSNIILGRNETGKSKLFDAFYWVLYDKVYDTDLQKFVKTKDMGIELVNRKTRQDCKKSYINCSVSLDFT